jgi:hypothetical protein
MDDRKHADSYFCLDRSLTSLVYARLSPHKRISIAIAATLGVWSVSAGRLRRFPLLLRRTQRCRCRPLLHYGVAPLLGFWSDRILLVTLTFYGTDQW